MQYRWGNQHRYVFLNMLLVLCVFRTVMTDVVDVTKTVDKSQSMVYNQTDIPLIPTTKNGRNGSWKQYNDWTTTSRRVRLLLAQENCYKGEKNI